ncbi:putative transmembrane protein [Candidatus Burkholderia pumila]|uniref:Transmembrane protein n=1 Tax=Candidatus Burkholderia pumila TaxID=1090375 RepID=A0ABR5HNR0_9BURK|nr:putative transmembrane protein [Candidatus Burkholderia pumila]
MHIIVAIAFILILGNLGSTLYFMTDKSRSKRMVWSLAARVDFSITLFLFILIAYRLG